MSEDILKEVAEDLKTKILFFRLEAWINDKLIESSEFRCTGEQCRKLGLILRIGVFGPGIRIQSCEAQDPEACNCGKWAEDGHLATCPQSKKQSVKQEMPNPEGPANIQSKAGPKELEKYRQERTRGHGRPERSS